jgi:uncharacterized membrane protein YkvI
VKPAHSLFAFLLSATVALAGCEVIGDIFKAGVWTGVILVVGAVGVVIWLISRSVS